MGRKVWGGAEIKEENFGGPGGLESLFSNQFGIQRWKNRGTPQPQTPPAVKQAYSLGRLLIAAKVDIAGSDQNGWERLPERVPQISLAPE